MTYTTLLFIRVVRFLMILRLAKVATSERPISWFLFSAQALQSWNSNNRIAKKMVGKIDVQGDVFAEQ